MTETTISPTAKERRVLRKAVENVLLICGIFAPLLYIGADVAAAVRFSGYSYVNQTISELMAIGAPTRPLLIVLFLLWNALVIAFGAGVWAAAGRWRAPRITGALLMAYSAASVAGLFSPMHLRGSAGSTTDVMHIVLTMAIVLCSLLCVGFGAAANGKGFSLYSIGTIVTMLVFGGMAGAQGPRIAVNLPTPWVGLLERASVYSSMLWMLVLAIVLLRARRVAAEG